MRTKLKKEAEELVKLLEMRIQTQAISETSKAKGSSNIKLCKCDALLKMPSLRIADLSERQADMFTFIAK